MLTPKGVGVAKERRKFIGAARENLLRCQHDDSFTFLLITAKDVIKGKYYLTQFSISYNFCE